MSRTLRPRSLAALGTALALAGTCTLAALPASAASIGDVASPTNEFFVPAQSVAPVTLGNAAAKDGLLPAGTYWVHDIDQPVPLTDWELPQVYLDALVEGWQAVELAEPGTITLERPVGVAGSTHTVLVFAAPAVAGDPATMTAEQIAAALGWTGNVVEDLAMALDAAHLYAADVDARAAAPALPDLDEGVEGVYGDVLGVGVDTFVQREGNVFTLYGPDGETSTMSFGRATDEYFVGDFDGDGRETIGLRRGNVFFLDNTWTGGAADVSYDFGRAGDTILVGDFDGDGTDTISLRRGATNFVSNAFKVGAAPTSFAYGRADDEALVGDWDHDGKDTISVLRFDEEPGTVTYYVKNSLTGGPADLTATAPLGD